MTVINRLQGNWDYQYSNNNSDGESFAPSDSESSVPENVEVRRPQRKRLPLYENFSFSPKGYGKKKLRRFNNDFRLQTLCEDEELHYVKLIDDYKSPFARLMEDEEALQLWNNLVESEHIELTNPTKLVSKEPLKRISAKIKRTMKLKKTLPLELIGRLEMDLVTFFQINTDSVYVCVPKTSFERLLLHGIAQYHNLCSISVIEDTIRHVEVYVNDECWVPVDECFCDIITKLGR